MMMKKKEEKKERREKKCNEVNDKFQMKRKGMNFVLIFFLFYFFFVGKIKVDEKSEQNSTKRHTANMRWKRKGKENVSYSSFSGQFESVY